MLKFGFLSLSKMLNKNTYYKYGKMSATELKMGNGEGTKKKQKMEISQEKLWKVNGQTFHIEGRDMWLGNVTEDV